MAIQMRRGEYSKFDKSKMVQGEFGMTTSGVTYNWAQR